jgi:hypothetical protein
MNKSQATAVLYDITARLQEHDLEISKISHVLDAKLAPIAQPQVDVLHVREGRDARRLRIFDAQGCM